MPASENDKYATTRSKTRVSSRCVPVPVSFAIILAFSVFTVLYWIVDDEDMSPLTSNTAANTSSNVPTGVWPRQVATR